MYVNSTEDRKQQGYACLKEQEDAEYAIITLVSGTVLLFVFATLTPYQAVSVYEEYFKTENVRKPNSIRLINLILDSVFSTN